jgi:hypothetical protein
LLNVHALTPLKGLTTAAAPIGISRQKNQIDARQLMSLLLFD